MPKKMPAKKPAAKMPPKGMHMMPGSKMPMRDSEMEMTPELQRRYPSMVKKANRRK